MGKAIESICLYETVTFKSFITALLSISKQKYLILLAKTKLVKSTFYINNFNSSAEARLLIEIGNSEFTFVILQHKTFTALATYQIATVNELNDLLVSENLLQHNFSKVDVVYNNKESVLVPTVLYNSNATNSYIELIYGDTFKGQLKTDFVYKHAIQNIYKIEYTIQKSMATKFPFATISHQYSLLPDSASLSETKLFSVFYQNKFSVLCCKQNQLQVIQQFEYANAHDVAYYLLAIAEQYTLDVNEVELQLCGMINENSALYDELHKYFKHLSFQPLPHEFDYVDDIKALPSHYFAHTFLFAACV
jgi:Protein of unknown function (DUF3822)